MVNSSLMALMSILEGLAKFVPRWIPELRKTQSMSGCREMILEAKLLDFVELRNIKDGEVGFVFSMLSDEFFEAVFAATDDNYKVAI